MMSEQPRRKWLDAEREWMLRAAEEYFQTGSCSVRCDRCGQPIIFRQLTPEVWEHSCSCGKYNGTMKGL
jgi:hypothetical protein